MDNVTEAINVLNKRKREKDEHLYGVIARLERYACARDRMVDKEVREISITDDDALALLDYIRTLLMRSY